MTDRTELDALLERLRKRWGGKWTLPGTNEPPAKPHLDMTTKTLTVPITCNHAPWCWCGAVGILNEPEQCAECGGELRLSTGPNREMNYRGESGYVIPEHIEFPECPTCGATWMDGNLIDMLSHELEVQREIKRAREGNDEDEESEP
jgi:hypothetical protein